MITLQFEPIMENSKFELSTEAIAADEMPLEIFLYRVGVDNKEIYSAVASVGDIDKYPAYSPDTSSVNQDGIIFYRKADIPNKVFGSPLALKTFRDLLTSEVEQLDKDYRATREEEGYGETEIVILNESD